MKHFPLLKIAAVFVLTALALNAQPGPRGGGGMGAPKGPKMEGGMRKLLGEHKSFSADLEVTMPGAAGEPGSMLMKMAFHEGKSRTDIDLSKTKGMGIQPQAMAQIQAFGMGQINSVSRPDKKLIYMVYPGLSAYMEQPMTEEATRSEDSYKLELEDQGKETVDSHPCEKKKFVVTDDQGTKRDGIVWKATDLKGFPIRIQSKEDGKDTTLTFKNVKLAKPDESFEPPPGYIKYGSQQEMMQAVMMKIQAGGGLPKQK